MADGAECKELILVIGMAMSQFNKSLILLGKMLHCSVYVLFEWRGDSDSPFAGQQALIEWKS